MKGSEWFIKDVWSLGIIYQKMHEEIIFGNNLYQLFNFVFSPISKLFFIKFEK